MVLVPVFETVCVRTDVGACDCTRWLSALGVDCVKQLLPHRGFEPASVLRLAFQSDTLPTELYPPLSSLEVH